MFGRRADPKAVADAVVASVSAVQFDADDVIVLTVTRTLDREEYPHIADALRREFPKQKFVVLESGMTLDKVPRSTLLALISAPEEAADVCS